MRPKSLTMAKTVAKVSVVSDTAGGRKSVARRSTGLDYSSLPDALARCYAPSTPLPAGTPSVRTVQPSDTGIYELTVTGAARHCFR